MPYKVGDVLLCHKHIGVAKFVGKLHGNDYRQLSSKSQIYIKESEIWVGLQLAEQPNMHTLSLMKPHHKHSKSLKAISYECFNTISFLDYFKANYGILIPYKYIHRKINAHQILTKLTQLFYSFKKTQKKNNNLTQKLKKLQNEMNTLKISKKVKSTSQKSLESIIYDQNGNSYHHHQKITRTTTHSYRSFKKHKDNDTNKDSNSVSDKAVDGVKDNHSDRNMSDDEGGDVVDDPPKKPSPPPLIASFNPVEEVINEENEQDYTLNKHARRYSAPWDDKKLTTQEFGTDYEKMYDPYWKISGSRHVLSNKHNDNDDSQYKHEPVDSAEMDMLPMIKEDPKTKRIYKLSRVKKHRHERSVSMSVVNVPRYFFEKDEEYPELPDL